jgi:hypothetical protein
MQNAKCKMQNAKCKMQNAKFSPHLPLCLGLVVSPIGNKALTNAHGSSNLYKGLRGFDVK